MRSRLLLAVFLSAIGLAACGGGDSEGGETTGAAADTGALTVAETQEEAPVETKADDEAFQIKVPASAPIGPTSPPKVIKQLQVALAMLGYKIGEPDGIYGDKTRKAVLAFQRKQKLERDGLVGAKTARAINKALRQQANQES